MDNVVQLVANFFPDEEAKFSDVRGSCEWDGKPLRLQSEPMRHRIEPRRLCSFQAYVLGQNSTTMMICPSFKCPLKGLMTPNTTGRSKRSIISKFWFVSGSKLRYRSRFILDKRKRSLFELMKHDGAPAAEHLAPLYDAASAGEGGV
ncbi:hypothetical protein BDR03DRAFT_611632 [Suillus americanus]|nr:hypothetical protein BDR03DRAFT_611632 [Suillus americanus]